MWKKNFATLEAEGFTRKELKELNDVQDPEGGRDSIVVAIGRRKAQTEAKRILAAAERGGGRKITDEEVLSCLRLWGFKENVNRANVTPHGEKFVYSDTIGVIKMSTCERTLMTLGTKRYPEFTQVITRWFRERMPKDLAEDFTYTSININKNYAGRLHRDGNNVGPSFIKAFGEFSGGELNYFPSDDKKKPLEEFDDKDKLQVNIKDNLMLFDGNRGHYVTKFKGERYSLVFFSLRTWNKVPAEDRKAAKECGIPLPTPKSMAYAQGLLGPKGPEGYRLWPVAADGAQGATPSKRGRPPAQTATPEKRRSTGGGKAKVSPEKAAPAKGRGVKRAAPAKLEAPAKPEVPAKRPRGRPPKHAQ